MSQPTKLHNFPPQPTSFIGREREIMELVSILEKLDCRLLTILAPGGMGKTRLSLEVAQTQVGHFANGVYFVPLAPLSSHQDIITTIAESIGFVFFGEDTPLQQLVNFLKDRAMFLVLDNFEHLLAGASIVTEMLQTAPDITLLVTSRERLNVRNEVVYHLRGLDFLTWETPDDALQYDAVKLFMQSAKRARSDFELQSDDLDYLAWICRLTVGMPLGIELAAGWVEVLSLEQIASEIQRGLDILETDMRDVPERHRSLRATFEQTWKRLTEDEKTIFARLSVFRGGFTLLSADAVAEASLRNLRKLAHKSLIQAETDERYTIHELLRQFGEDKLAETNEYATIQDKHAAYFADYMLERKQDSKTNRQPEALDLISADYDNVRVAWLYAVDHHQWEQLPKFLHSLWFYCDLRALNQDANNLLQYAINQLEKLADSDVTNFALGYVKAVLSWTYTSLGNPQLASVIGKEALDILLHYNDMEAVIFARYSLGYICLLLNQQDVALDHSQEALSLAQTVQDTYWEGHCSEWIAFAYVEMDNFVQAIKFGEQALKIYKEMGNYNGKKNAYNTLGNAYLGLQQFDKAKSYYKKGLKVASLLGHRFAVANYHQFLARTAIHESDYQAGMQHLKYALQVFWDTGYTWMAHVPLLIVARIYTDQNHVDKAIEIFATIQSQRIVLMRDIQMANALYAELQEIVEPGRFAKAWKRGQARAIVELINELLSEQPHEKSDIPEPIAQPLAEPLSKRELEVLALVAEGLTNSEIADKLYISVGTVRVHTRHIYNKLAVNNRTEAAAKARSLNLL